MNRALLLLTLAACGTEAPAPAPVATKYEFELQGALAGRRSEVVLGMSILTKHYGHDVQEAIAALPVTIKGTSENIVCGKVTSNVAGCSHLSDSTRADLEVFMYAATRVADSALIHELGHTTRRLVEGDSDGTHSDAAFWSLIGAAEDEFSKRSTEPRRN